MQPQDVGALNGRDLLYPTYESQEYNILARVDSRLQRNFYVGLM